MGITATPTNVPDWDALQIEPACPLCEYSLRGLTEPRCPECGRRFEWADLTDPSRRKHPYLFEHHPERNVWSLVRTLVGGLRPGRFWRSLSPVQPSRPGRLAVYFVLAVLPLVLATGAEWMRTTYEQWLLVRQRFALVGSAGPQPPTFWGIALGSFGWDYTYASAGITVRNHVRVMARGTAFLIAPGPCSTSWPSGSSPNPCGGRRCARFTWSAAWFTATTWPSGSDGDTYWWPGCRS